MSKDYKKSTKFVEDHKKHKFHEKIAKNAHILLKITKNKHILPNNLEKHANFVQRLKKKKI